MPAESGWISTLTAGIALSLPLGRHGAELGYRLESNWFFPFSESDYTDQYLNGRLSLDFPGGLKGRVAYDFKDSRIPRRGEEIPGLSGAADPFREKPYQSKDFCLEGGYALGEQWSLEGRYDYYDYAYRESIDKNGNLQRNLFGGSVFYRFTGRTRLLLDYTYATIDYPYEEINNNRQQTFYAGLGFDPTAKISGFLKLGWSWLDYDRESAGRKNSLAAPSYLVDLKYRFSPDDLLSFSAERIIREDVDTYTAYTTDRFNLSYRHALAWNPKISLSAAMGYGTLRFDAATVDADGRLKIRDDRQWSGRIIIGYDLRRWLVLETGYRYVRNDSSHINYDYAENRVWLKASAKF
jgi:hypothetical protein